jgi:protein-S-isoprenylcysteine O-methyltransferase Ste14
MTNSLHPPSNNRALVLKAVAFVVLVAGTVGFAIPAALLWWDDGHFTIGLGRANVVGLVPLLAGAAIYLSGVVQLTMWGKGIPAPVAPTSSLVTSGLYGFVRNPMYLAAILFLSGEAILMSSGILTIYTVLLGAAYYFGVIWLEEPALVRRFGRSYENYCARVPRWVPSLSRIQI